MILSNSSDQPDRQKVSRFFSKLIAEALNLDAGNVTLRRIGDEVEVCLLSGDRRVQSSSIKGSWHGAFTGWLAARRWLFGGERQVLVREGAQLFVATVTETEREIQLGGFRSLPLRAGLEEFGVRPELLGRFELLSSQSRGLLIAGVERTPQGDALIENIQALTNYRSIDWSAAKADPSELYRVALEEPLLVRVEGNDPLEALLKLRDEGLDLRRPIVLGAIVAGIVPRICLACADDAQITTAALSPFPLPLQDLLRGARVLSSRGCDLCARAGSAGVIGLQSLLVLDQTVRPLLISAAGTTIVPQVYPRATTPLLDDAVRKVVLRKIALSAAEPFLTSLPQPYRNWFGSLAPRAEEEALPIGDGFFDTVPAGSPRPQSGHHIMRSDVDALIDRDLPLLGAKRTQKRAKDVRTLLVVEDDPDQRNIIEMLLRSANYDVHLAADGIEALDEVRRRPPDLIISDLMMPQMDGTEFVRRLKSNPDFSSIPVLILTVLGDSDKEFSLLSLGVDDYCEKTVQRKILLKRIENLLRRAGTPLV